MVADTSTPADVLDHLRTLGGDRLQVVALHASRSTSPTRSTSARSAADGEHLLMLNDDMEVVTPDWIERLVMYSAFPRHRCGRRQAALRRRAAAARRRHGATTPCPATSTAATGRLRAATPTSCAWPNNYSAVTGACLMTPAGAVRRGRRAVAAVPAELQRRRLLPEGPRRRAAGSSTTPTPCCTTSSRRAGRPRCRAWELELFRDRWTSTPRSTTPTTTPTSTPAPCTWCRPSTTPTAPCWSDAGSAPARQGRAGVPAASADRPAAVERDDAAVGLVGRAGPARRSARPGDGGRSCA